MAGNWEYKVITIKKDRSFWATSHAPDDDTFTDLLNREGQRGWELVNVVSIAPVLPFRAFFKRPR